MTDEMNAIAIIEQLKIMDFCNKPEIIDDCLSHIEEDFMPFHDVFRSIYGFDNLKPDKKQLSVTFELISYLLKNKDVIPVFGPEMKPSGKSIATDLDLIKSVIEINPYDDYNYGIWFDTTENWKKE